MIKRNKDIVKVITLLLWVTVIVYNVAFDKVNGFTWFGVVWSVWTFHSLLIVWYPEWFDPRNEE